MKTDVFASFVEVGKSSLQIYLSSGNGVWNLPTREKWYIRTQIETSGLCATIGIGIIGSKTTTKTEALTCRSIQAWKSGVACRIELHFTVFHSFLPLLDGDVMLQCILNALLEGP